MLGDRLSQVAKIVEFMGARDVCRSMRRGSIIAIKSEKDVVSGAKKGREAKMANTLSCQFKNLSRGESFIAGQFKKWAKEMKEEPFSLFSLQFAKRFGCANAWECLSFMTIYCHFMARNDCDTSILFGIHEMSAYPS